MLGPAELAAAVAAFLAERAGSLLVLLAATLAFYVALRSALRGPPPPPAEPQGEGHRMVGEISLEELQGYTGADVTKPILLAVRGRVFDVSKGRDFYGPGGGYNLFAGHECSCALAKMSLQAEDLHGDLSEVTPEQLGYLKEWEDKFSDKYTVVGSICESLRLSPEELATYDGSDPDKPILLSIRGRVYDVSKGRDFYGPGGAYPFAGCEVARALAKTSLDKQDFNANLEGLSHTETRTLGEWERKFDSKYKVVGTLAA
mmetsp:Transcript_12270/g.30974  ORF Transcript_12270/g.30974 Transcript_12270/m.30974 type:complete len:259 (-) Transcript_12270:378-1154(-)|eukprot:jgi/Tetstr1/421822/TSEL_012723.t1